MTERSVTHATFVIERVYDATPARVFKAWSDPKARDRWFVDRRRLGGHGDTSIDFRIGGREFGRFSQTGKNIYTNDTVYQDIVPDQPHHLRLHDGEGWREYLRLRRDRGIEAGRQEHAPGLHRAGRFPGWPRHAPPSREAGWQDLLNNLGKEFAPLSKSA